MSKVPTNKVYTSQRINTYTLDRLVQNCRLPNQEYREHLPLAEETEDFFISSNEAISTHMESILFKESWS
jgi:hypothetical protein